MRLKASQLRELTDEELAQKKGAIKKELFNLRYQAKIGRIDKPHRMSQARREIAKIETILTERGREKK
jgi:large subunit ribosomal protein L29